MDTQPPRPEEENPYEAPQLPGRAPSGSAFQRFVMLLGLTFLTPLAVLVSFGVTCSATLMGLSVIGAALGEMLGARWLGEIVGVCGWFGGLVLGVVVAGKVARIYGERWKRVNDPTYSSDQSNREG